MDRAASISPWYRATAPHELAELLARRRAETAASGDGRELLTGGGDVVQVARAQGDRLLPGLQERGRRRGVGVGQGHVELLGIGDEGAVGGDEVLGAGRRSATARVPTTASTASRTTSTTAVVAQHDRRRQTPAQAAAPTTQFERRALPRR